MARNCGIETSSSALQAEAKAMIMAIQTTIHNNITNLALMGIEGKPIGLFFPFFTKFGIFVTVFPPLSGDGFLDKQIWQPFGLPRSFTKPSSTMVHILSIDGLPCPH
ncbi:hypothetical protein DVH24_027933 [Malus domestica]|uniref:Uncharacterized protein n=1 Tax=Malus domestica TaxID=3750 RepID=A0A498H8S6_MALDO|nr:hypothetical protein DVH24_027933 [Malus domestica]